MKDKFILDACCGGRMFWFDKKCKCVMFGDNRDFEDTLCDGRKLVIKPDIIMDFRDLKFQNNSFKLVVFDPPHMKTLGQTSMFRKKFGCLNVETWPHDLKQGFKECWRVLDDYGVLIFKWNEAEIKLKTVLALFPEEPLFGHPTRSKSNTHWLTFMKIPKRRSFTKQIKMTNTQTKPTTSHNGVEDETLNVNKGGKIKNV